MTVIPAPSTVALLVAVELGLGLGVVGEVHPAQLAAAASAMRATKLATRVFFIYIPRSFGVKVKYKEDAAHLIVSIRASTRDAPMRYNLGLRRTLCYAP
ncbi:MAG TPA: hypothetical protein VEB88_01485 [Candidatus Acidoferrales bacterium]|jgi:hypothetical protein|nr:hypothetical protein [Candidatus Acidoferrales bacterium]